MSRLLMPLILVLAAIGLFVMYINPTYQASKALQAQVSALDDALDKVQELKKRHTQLLSKRNTFPSEQIQRLERLLPDNVDNIRFIIDVNNIAAQQGLSLKEVELGGLSQASAARSEVAVGPSGDPVGSIEIGFSVAADYEKFLTLLAALEHSLRLIDIEDLSFSAGEGTPDYSFTIRTYWLH